MKPMEHVHRFQPEMARMIGRAPEAVTMSVIAVQFRRGEGCCIEDPVRMVTAYYSLEGELLAERDSMAPAPAVRETVTT